MLKILSDMVGVWVGLGGGEGGRLCGGVLQAVPIQPLVLQRPEHLECTQCEHLVHRQHVPWLMTLYNQTDQEYNNNKKKSAKLIAIHNIPLPHTHILIYCNKLNSGCCLSVDSVNVNKL